MTVNELIEKLLGFKDSGKGDWIVEMPVRDRDDEINLFPVYSAASYPEDKTIWLQSEADNPDFD